MSKGESDNGSDNRMISVAIWTSRSQETACADSWICKGLPVRTRGFVRDRLCGPVDLNLASNEMAAAAVSVTAQFRTNLVRIWYQSDTNLVPISYEYGINLVLIWYESGTNLVQSCTNLIRICYQSGTNLVRIWHESNTNLVPIWYEYDTNLIPRARA